MKKRAIIMVAPNGAKKTKEILPQIPLWPDELAEEAKNCAANGASIFHLHIRNKEQGHTLDAGIYRETIAEIKKRAGENIIVQATTENCGIYQPHEQMQMVRELKPEAISCAVREFVPDASHEGAAKDFLAWVQQEKIWPQYILYSPDEIRKFADLKARGIIPAAHDFVLLVLGRKSVDQPKEAFARPHDVDPYIKTVKEVCPDVTWAVCAFGGYENECMKYAFANGGHARIGFENNHWLIDESIAASNAALVKQLVETSGIMPLTAQEVRKVYMHG
jgi:uncharacterized protein (DUF849 family)